MSAIDAVTNTNTYQSILQAQGLKKNKDLDFNSILMASMQPSLPGMDSESSQSQVMLEVAMIQQMQALVTKLDAVVQKLDASNTKIKGE